MNPGSMRILVWVLSMGLLWVETAWAGPPELFRAVVPARDDNTLIVAYDWGGGGFYFSSDAGQKFGMLCSDMIEPGLSTDDVWGMRQRADGKVYLGLFSGMLASDETQCTWSRVPMFESRWVTDIVADPEDRNVSYAITSTGEGKNGMYRNDGKSDAWTLVGEEKEVFLTRLHVVKTESGKRFYQSLVIPARTAQENPRYFIRWSEDGGMTWTEHEYPGTDGALRLMAVDPTNPDRIVVAVQRTSAMAKDDVLFSTMRGQPGSFQMIGQVVEATAVEFLADGSLFYGDNDSASTGLYKVDKLGDAPRLLKPEYKVGCLRYDAAQKRLYMCRDWLFGSVDPSSGEFTTLADMRAATSFHACPDEQTTANKCEAQFNVNFCGWGHYPESPLCQKFYPGSPRDAPGGVSGTGGGVAGAAAAGGGGWATGAAGTAAGQAGALGASGASGAPVTAGAGGTAGVATGEPPAQRKKSGCAVAAHGADSPGGGLFVLTAALAMYAVRRGRVGSQSGGARRA